MAKIRLPESRVGISGSLKQKIQKMVDVFFLVA
jgi:hypothetical protein